MDGLTVMTFLLGCHIHAVLKRMTAFLTTTVTESFRGQQFRFTFVTQNQVPSRISSKPL